MDKHNEIALQLENILKVYPNGVVANRDVNMTVYKGEIHALIGENGAGKSTLMKIIFGVENPDQGNIYINKEKVTIQNPSSAIDHGIGMVHQHFMLVDSLSVAENIFLGYEPTKHGVMLDKQKMNQLSEEYAEKYHFNIDVKSKIRDVSVGVKQETEILKALARGAKILILDEPTAVLTPQETKQLFLELKTLKEQGHTIIFISHKLNEVVEICDRITIMRNGTTVETTSLEGITTQEISNKMVGREVVLNIEKENHEFGEPVIEASGLTYINSVGKRTLDNVSFVVRSGEIMSIAGVEGNGQSEIAGILSGNLTPISGDIYINKDKLKHNTVLNHRNKGMVYIPQDRMTVGCATGMSIAENLIATDLNSHIKSKYFLDESNISATSEQLINDYKIKCINSNQLVNMLSGGNMQKVVAARELSSNVKVVVAEQPTRGIDPGAAELIRQQLVKLRDEGAAVILISADLNEVLELSDSCMVMYNGEINGYFEDTKNLTEEELGYYMLGVKSMNCRKEDMYAESTQVNQS